MKRIFIALGAVLAMLPMAAVAHHSFTAEYDGSKATNLVGIISRVDQQNPHGWIYMQVTGANGRVTEWGLETPGPNQLVRNGFSKDFYQSMIDKKEIVTAKAYPARDGSKHAFVETITRADKKTVITISTGGVDGAVGRAPNGPNVTVDGVAVPESASPGGAAGGRGGAGGGGRGGAPQGGGARQ